MRHKRRYLCGVILLAALMPWKRALASQIEVVPRGGTVYEIRAVDLPLSAALELDLFYSTSAYFNPTISRGGFPRGAALNYSDQTGGIIKISVVKGTKPFEGSGTLVTVNFQAIAEWPGSIDGGNGTLTMEAAGGIVPIPVLVSGSTGTDTRKVASKADITSKPSGTEINVIRKQGALGRYLQNPLSFKGEDLLDVQLGKEMGQEPRVALSDGGPVTLTIPLAICSAPRMFSLDRMNVIAARQDDQGGWTLSVIPYIGTCRASLSVWCDNTLTVYPLTVAPSLSHPQDTPSEEECPSAYVSAANLIANKAASAQKP